MTTPFHDLDQYVALPRLGGLALSPDGTRLVATVATRTPKATGYTSALWELDPAGERPARRLTRSAKGEGAPAFAVDNTLYFSSSRPDPEGDDDAEGAALWAVPADGGEARVVLRRPGGVQGVWCARAADAVVVKASVLPGAPDEKAHAHLHGVRTDRGVDAILHSGYPVRFWDHDLGPAQAHFHGLETDADAEAPKGPVTTDHVDPRRLRRLTDGVGGGLHEASPVLSPDGTFLLTGVETPGPRGDVVSHLVRVDVATGERTTLFAETERELDVHAISPDGSLAAGVVWRRSTPETAPVPTLVLVDTGDGSLRELAPEWDLWAAPVGWLPDGSAIVASADEDGRAPIFTVAIADGSVTRLTEGAAAYSSIQVAPDGSAVYALRASYEHPAEPVRVALDGSGETAIPSPVARPEVPGRLEEVETTTEDGTRIRAWLARPDDDTRAPLLLWIHGGPLGSWNAWSWRWNPWIMVARGYAVLLPDPALSTGYGQEFIQRGWGSWGEAPYTDLMAITDAACARGDIDETRTAAMGGSFGGYMANWVAGQTDRFDAIVTHASLWALDQFGPTTDASFYWQREMTAEMALANSPHRHVERIVSPMLVIHGDKDYRVPIGEGLRLWYELLSASGSPAGEDGTSPHRFLYFPHENHWILSPQHAKVWYAVVLDFLGQHVLGEPAADLPPELGLHADPERSEES